MQRVWVGLPAVCCGVSAARWRTVPPRVTTPFQVTYQICGEFRWVTSCMLWSECSRMVDCTATCHYSITGNVPNYAESAGGVTSCMLWSECSRMAHCTETCHISITGNVPNYAESAGGFTSCMLWSECSRMADCTATCHYSITDNIPNYVESAGGVTSCMLWSKCSKMADCSAMCHYSITGNIPICGECCMLGWSDLALFCDFQKATHFC